MRGKKYRYKGESLTVGEWAKRIGVSTAVLGMRIHKGWTIARALTEPVIHRKRKAEKSIEKAEKSGKKKEKATNKVVKLSQNVDAPAKKRRGRPPKSVAAVSPSPAEKPTQAKDGATVAQDAANVGERQEIPVPKRPMSTNKDFLRGMAEGIWLTISSVAMMMAESGDNVAAKNLKRVEDMFKGGFAEKFMAAVSDKKKGK